MPTMRTKIGTTGGILATLALAGTIIGLSQRYSTALQPTIQSGVNNMSLGLSENTVAFGQRQVHLNAVDVSFSGTAEINNINAPVTGVATIPAISEPINELIPEFQNISTIFNVMSIPLTDTLTAISSWLVILLGALTAFIVLLSGLNFSLTGLAMGRINELERGLNDSQLDNEKLRSRLLALERHLNISSDEEDSERDVVRDRKLPVRKV